MVCEVTSKLLSSICFISYFPPSEEGLAYYTKKLVDAIQKEYAKPLKLYVIKQRKNEEVTTVSTNGVVVYPIWNMDSYKSSIVSIVLTLILIRSIHPDIIHVQYGPSRKYGGTIGEPFLLLLLFFRLFSNSTIFLSIHSLLHQRNVEEKVAKIVKINLAGKIYAFYYKYILKFFFSLPNQVLIVANCEFFSLGDSCSLVSYLSRSKDVSVKIIPHGIFESKVNSIAERSIASSVKKLLLLGHIRQGRYDSVFKALSLASETLTGKLKVTVAGPLLFKQDTEYLVWLMQESERLKIKDFLEYNVKWLSEEEFTNQLSESDYVFVNFQEAVKASGILSWAISQCVPAIVMMDESSQVKIKSAPFLVAKDERTLVRILIQIISDDSLKETLTSTIANLQTQYSFDKIASLHISLYAEAIEP